MIAILEQNDLGALKLKNFLILLAIVSATLESFSYLNIYAEMSYKMVGALLNNGIAHVEKSRQFLFYFRDFPLYLGIFFGISDLNILTKLHGIGFFGSSTLFWMYALFRLRRDNLFWPFFCIFAICYLSCHLGGGAESVFLNSLVAVSSAILLKKSNISNADILFYCVSCVLLTHTYELVIIYAPLLVLMSLHRIFIDKRMPILKKYLVVICVPIILYSIYPAYIWINILKTHADKSVYGYNYVFQYKSFSCGMAVAYIFLVLYYFNVNKILQNIFVAIMWVLLCVVVIDTSWTYLPIHFFVRFYNFMSMFVFICLVFVFNIIKSIHTEKVKKIKLQKKHIAPVLTLYFILLFHSAYLAYYHYNYIKDLRFIVNNNTGTVCIDDFPLKNRDKYDWSWTFPLLSLLVRSDQSKAIISNSRQYKGWQPFNPYENSNVPNLDKYYMHNIK